MKADQNTVVLMARLPRLGRVKTRLDKDLAEFMGEAAAKEVVLALYTAFVEDMVASMATVPARLQLWVDGMGASQGQTQQEAGAAVIAEARDWLGQDLDVRLQPEGDLGHRMDVALRTAFAEGAERAVLLGTDVPDYSPKVVGGALEVLHRVDAVLGPAMDGGYYAIGFAREAYTPAVFEEMPWGTDAVRKATEAALKAAGREYLLLPEWTDVDGIRDLNVLFRANRQSSFAKSKTYALLKPHAELLAKFDLDLPSPEEVMGPDHVLARLRSMQPK